MAKRGRTPIQLSLALNTEALQAGVKRAQSQLNKLKGVGDVASSGMKALGKGMLVATKGATVLGALTFILAKREDKNVKYNDILSQLTINSVKTQDEVDDIPKA